MPCAGSCGKCLIVFFNILFFLIGIGFIAVGIVLKLNFDVLDDTEVLKLLDKVTLSNDIGIGTLLVNLSTVIIVLGSTIMIVTILAICGVCAKNRCLLTLYAIIVIFLCLATSGALVFWILYKGTVDNHLENEFRELLEDYKGESSTEEVTVGWNFLFIGYDCCGVKAITSSNDEFATATSWSRAANQKIPYSCCTAATEDNYKTGSDTTCTETLTAGKYHSKGCFEKIRDWVEKYQLAIIICLCSLIALQVLAIIFAFLICCELHYGGNKIGSWK